MGRAVRVLVAEESDPAAQQLLGALQAGGFAPTARRVQTPDALSAALRAPWQALLVAHGLPQLGVPTALRLVTTAGVDLPVLVAAADEAAGQAAMRAGACDYVLRDHLGRLPLALARELRLREERQRIATALRESQETYNSLFETSHAVVLLVDPQTGTIVDANPAACSFYGYSRAQMTTLSITDINTSPPEQTFEDMARARDMTQQHFLFRHRLASGEVREVEVYSGPIRARGRQFLYSIIYDITERVRAEAERERLLEELREALRRTESLAQEKQHTSDLLQTLIDTMPAGVMVCNARGELTFTNPAARVMLGGPPLGTAREAPAGTLLLTAQGTPFPPSELPLVRAIGRGQTSREVQIMLRLGSGEERTIAAAASPLRTPTGEITGAVAVFHDITARKRAESELLRERALLSTAIDILPFPLGITSPTGEVLRANQAGCRFFGGPDPSAWQPVQFLNPDTRAPVPPEQWPVSRALAGKVITGVEGLVVLPDGREVPVLIQSGPVIVSDEVVGAVWTFQDITALKEADRAKDQFLAVLSHELLTPLTNIWGWTQAAQRTPEITSQALEVIGRNVQRQRHILNDLLDVSRIVHGKLFLQPQPTELWDLAAQSGEDFQQQAQERQLDLVLPPPPAPLPVHADPARIRQAIGNLLANALQFTEPGGTITISARREGEMAVLSVQDTGRGIAPEVLPHLFRPFRQFPRPEAGGGLGLGLALVKGIVELHGGRVTAASPGLGQGSTFTIELPLGPPA